MKTRILFFCISCLLWASCENSRQNYVIEGTLPSVKYDGEWIYLVPMENAPGRVDSVKITNASFSFSGQGEEMRVLRLRHLLRIYIQELLVVTEPGTIHVKADSVGSVTGTPQNDALQKWKEGREKMQEAYHFIRTGLRNATGKDSLHLTQIRDSLRMQEQETNFLFLKEQGNNTLGTFIRKKKKEQRFGVVPFFLPDIALSSVPSGADTALFACHRTIGRVSVASGGSGTFVRRFPHSILLLRRGWSGHNGCRAVALGSGGVSFVGSVHGTLGVGSYGVGGGLGGRKAMRIELSAFRHNRFNRYRRCFVVVP